MGKRNTPAANALTAKCRVRTVPRAKNLSLQKEKQEDKNILAVAGALASRNGRVA